MGISSTGAMWVVVLLLAASILAGLGVYAWRRRSVPGASSFGLLMFAVAGYSLIYALELLGPDLPTKMLWLRVEYPFIVATPVLWLIFALQYTGKGQWLSRRNVLLLSAVPLVTLLAVWTNPIHHLYYSSTGIEAIGSWTLLHLEYATWFWVHITFSYLCLLAGTALLADAFLRGSSPPLYRRQAAVLLLGALIPWLGDFLYLARVTPWPNLDLTPLAFTFSGLIIAYGLFRYRLLQVVPVARRMVLEGMPTAMIVLDAEGRIADLNPAARQLFGLNDQEAIGQPAAQVLGPPELVAHFAEYSVPERSGAGVDTEVEWGSKGVYRVTISPLNGGSAGQRGAPRLILISDITEQTRAREALTLTNRRLLALQESTAALTALLDPATLFDRVIEQLECLLPCHRAILSLYDEATDRLTYVASRGVDPEELAEAQDTALQRHPGWVLRNKAPLLVTDSETDLRVKYVGAPRNRSMIIVPLLYQERCLGILGLGSPEPSAYTLADQDLLVAFANQVAVALENARLYESERSRRRLADTQREVGRALSATLAIDEVLDRILEQLERVVEYHGATVALVRSAGDVSGRSAGDVSGRSAGDVSGRGAGDVSGRGAGDVSGQSAGDARSAGRGERLEVVAAWGFADPAPIMDFRLDVSDNAIFQQMAAEGRPIIIGDVSQDPRWVWVDGVEFTRAWIGAPLMVKGRVIGQLAVYHPQAGRYHDEDGLTLQTFAQQAAVAIENARLYDELRASATRLEQRVEMRTRELQEAQARLLQAERLAALGQLSASVAHEIGHPLSLIHGYVELLAEEQPDHPYLSPVRDSIQQLTRFLAQLRDFARPATDERDLVELPEVVDRVLALTGKELTYSRVEVHQERAASLPPVRANERQLEQVFLNLVLNARDAMPRGGELWVRTFQMADQIVVEFADRGMGIPPENLKRIFEPYFTTKESNGTGLGLAISQSILKTHAGRIEVSSQPGEGATFRVYLPIGHSSSHIGEVS